MFSHFFLTDYIPFMGWVDKFQGLISRLEKCFEESDNFYEQVIQDHVDDKRQKNEDQEDIIDVMIRLMKENSYSTSLSYNHIKTVLIVTLLSFADDPSSHLSCIIKEFLVSHFFRLMCFFVFTLKNIFVAGSDTTASTLVWAMTALMKRPQAMEKVKNEIKDVVEEKDFVSEDDTEKLPYLRAVIKETWRLFPTVPLLVPRETIQRCNLNGYEIQPKTLVFLNAWAIGRDPDAWKEPEMFHPERFLDSSVNFNGQHYELIPFGAGRRICTGIHMGVASVELALANLIHAFKWALPPEMKQEDLDTESKPGITVHKKNPLCLIASG